MIWSGFSSWSIGAAPDVDFDDAELHQRGTPSKSRMNRSSWPSSGSFMRRIVVVHAGRGVLLEEALAADAVGRAHQAERPVDDELLHARPDLFIVLQQVLLATPCSSGHSSFSGWLSLTAVFTSLAAALAACGFRPGRRRLGAALRPALRPSPPVWASPPRPPPPACPRADPGTRRGAGYCSPVQARNSTSATSSGFTQTRPLPFGRWRRSGDFAPSARRASSSDRRPSWPKSRCRRGRHISARRPRDSRPAASAGRARSSRDGR